MAIYGLKGKTANRTKTIIYWLFIEKKPNRNVEKNHIWPVFGDTLRIHCLAKTSDKIPSVLGLRYPGMVKCFTLTIHLPGFTLF